MTTRRTFSCVDSYVYFVRTLILMVAAITVFFLSHISHIRRQQQHRQNSQTGTGNSPYSRLVYEDTATLQKTITMMSLLKRRSAVTSALLYLNVLITLSQSSPRVDRLHHDCAFAFVSNQRAKGSDSVGRLSTLQRLNPSIATMKRNSLSSFHLFSTKFDGDQGGDSDEQDDLDDLDFSTWTRALRRWPLYPSSKSTEEEENAMLTKKDSKQGIPLANLINVEALLMASGEETMDSVEDIELFEFGEYTLENADAKNRDGTLVDAASTKEAASPTPLSILPSLEQLGNWDKIVGTIQRSISDLTGSSRTLTTDIKLKEATALIEDFISEASTAISPAAVQDLIVRASQTLYLEENANSIVKTAEKIAQQQGLNVSEAAERAKETTKFTRNLVKLANGLIVSGYIDGDLSTSKNVGSGDISGNTKPLFDGYKSVAAISSSDYNRAVAKGAEMGDLAGAVYGDMIQRTQGIGHSMVANGTSSDVSWMITDSIAYEDEFGHVSDTDKHSRKPVFVRTITISGFDASDESVDREQLLNTICTANPVTMGVAEEIKVHSGLLSLAKAVYSDIEKYIDRTAPTHRIVFNGHSVGGSVSTLLLFLLVEARGGGILV